jgi:hypothetical protein
VASRGPRPAAVGERRLHHRLCHHAVLARLGWNVEECGLYGAPEIGVVIGDEAHATILAALQMLGLGRERVKRVAADSQGKMKTESLREVLAGCHGPLDRLGSGRQREHGCVRFPGGDRPAGS